MPLVGLLHRAERGEEDDLADVIVACEGHHQAVNADAACRRHADLQHFYVIFVQYLLFIVAALKPTHALKGQRLYGLLVIFASASQFAAKPPPPQVARTCTV